ncbi:MAG: hypothetical protein JWQ98_1044 [Chlorobi bacterium]|nr:hypothetical protein [Chlorobiota bacterium]
MKSMIRIFRAVLAVMIIIAPARLSAQYTSGAFGLKQLSETYDERGFEQGKSISVDGKLMVSGSNGNVSYSYPISHTTVSGFPFDVSLNYCGSVGCTAFKNLIRGAFIPPMRDGINSIRIVPHGLSVSMALLFRRLLPPPRIIVRLSFRPLRRIASTTPILSGRSTDMTFVIVWGRPLAKAT